VSNSNRRLAINIIANCIAFAVNFLINFFLTPYIVENVGKEIYGFVALGNNFVTYASLITIAINSMASRFITIKIEQKDYESASKYFSSVLFANILICLVLTIPMTLIVIFMQYIVDVPVNGIHDIKMLWALLFINFFIELMSNVFSISTFATNRVDLSARRSIEGYIIKAVILVGCYKFFPPYVLFVGVSTTIYSLYNLVINIRYKKKLIPEVEVKKTLFEKRYIKDLITSGIWNTISRVGSIALTELDLLLSNILIDASAMGILSLVKLIPNYIVSLTSTITNAFMPQLTISYAKEKEDKNYMLNKIRNSIRILLVFHSVIYGILIAFSDVFYRLWLPGETQETISYMYMIGIISIGGCFISAVSNVMSNIFTVFNKLKVSSITVILTGLISSLLTFVIVKNTSLGLIAIAGVSVVLVIIRNIVILMPYAAKCIGVPIYTFYKDMILNIFVIACSVFISFFIKNITNINGWIEFIIICAIDATIIFAINFFIILKKEERQYIISKLRKEQKNV